MMTQATRTLVTISLLLAVPLSAMADVDLEWRPMTQTIAVGDVAEVGLYAVSDNTEDQAFSSAQVIMNWDPAYLLLTGNSTVGAVPLLGSSFIPNDSFGINESNPPTDGNGMWVGTVQFGQEQYATPAGTLLTTMLFEALAETPSTLVHMLSDLTLPPHPTGMTKLLNLQGDALGTLGDPAEVVIIPEPGTLGLALLGVLALARRR